MKPLPISFFFAAAIAPDAAASVHIPLEYYIATLSVLGTVVVVLKTWSWVRKEVTKGLLTKAEFAVHLEYHKSITEKLDTIISALQGVPWARGSNQRTRAEDRPALTPIIGVNILPPRDPSP